MTENREMKIDVCIHQNQIEDRGDVICADCGLVLEERLISFKKNTYVLNNIKKVERSYPSQYVGIEYTLVKSTIIRPEWCNISKFKRLYLIDKWFDDDRNEIPYYLKINLINICKSLYLSSEIFYNALYIIRKIFKENKVINKVTMFALSLYVACKNVRHNTITIQQISESFYNKGHWVTPRLIMRSYLLYNKTINKILITKKDATLFFDKYITKIIEIPELDERMRIVGCSLTKPEIASKLSKISYKLYNMIKNNTSTCRPSNLGASIIYAANVILSIKYNFSKNLIIQKDFATAVKISDYSIRDLYVKHLKKIVTKIRSERVK